MVLPDYRRARIQRKYAEIRLQLPKLDGEVKGRLLNERHVADVVSLLRSNDALFWAAAIDLSYQSDAAIRGHQMEQAARITANLTPTHHPNIHRELQELRSALESFAPQLYVQSVLMFELIHRTLRDATLYFSQHQPKELSAFHWELDAKGTRGITKWEKWWTDVVLPILQSKSQRDPWPQLVEGNYSFMKRFETTAPDGAPPPSTTRKYVAWNARLILEEDFSFAGNATPGLELVDILVNAVRRALVGNLKPGGFASIASIMTDRRPGLSLLTLDKNKKGRPRSSPYDEIILRYFTQGGRSLLLLRR
jgi:hypothetical protein